MYFKIYNYRNIPFGYPIELNLSEGVIFILGPNNIGKTALLKLLYEFRPMFQYGLDGNSPNGKFGVKLLSTFDKIVHIKNDQHSEIVIEIRNDQNYILKYRILPTNTSNTHSDHVIIDFSLLNVASSTTESRNFIREIHEKFSNTFFAGVFRTPEMIAAGNSFDLEIGSTFINTWSDWSDTAQVQKMQKIKKLKEELKALFDFKNFDIRTNRDRNNLIVTTDDGEFLLSELGSGIGQFILIMAKSLFSPPSYILIDEPEACLHPRMQEAFVRALASKTKFGLIAASHSIGLARSVADSIYLLSKNDNGPVLNPYGKQYTPSLAHTLSEMNYSQYVEIGGNNILLVEGRTDVKFFKEVLRKFEIERKFIIIPLGGGEFLVKDKSKIRDELNELKRLEPNSISVIFDSEITEEMGVLNEKLQSFKDLCEELGFITFATERHSTENYLSQDAINKVLGKHYTALGPYENFNSLKNKWPKEKSWKVVCEMEKSDFVNAELGKFITEKLYPASS